MTSRVEQILIPDLGGAAEVTVIEVLVKPGDQVNKEQSLITLEGEKATMDVPSPFAGTIKNIQVKIGNKVSEGTVILTMTVGDSEKKTEKTEKIAEKTSSAAIPASEEAVYVPDLGEAHAVNVIEINVKVAEVIKVDQPLITLEGDKATLEVPSPLAGKIKAIKIKVGDKVSTGDVILLMSTTSVDTTSASPSLTPSQQKTVAVEQPTAFTETAEETEEFSSFGTAIHAGPAVRRIAREFGVDLMRIRGTGAKSRILKEDVQQFVKTQLRVADSKAAGINFSSVPLIDFSKFGNIEKQPLSKIKKLTGVNLSRNWMMIPHVTQFGEADVTELEAFRESQKSMAAEQGVRLTPLVFIMKAVVAALKQFPHFNASLDTSGENIILKKYFHLGVAVDTPNGLVVPVIRDVDRKGLFELAKELADISEKARTKGLSMTDMQGGCFSISSLGGIGGTAFTPIINAPEVAILGISKMEWRAVYKNQQDYHTRLMLPLSLSYDHRVIDGADGARFIAYLTARLAEIRTLLL